MRKKVINVALFLMVLASAIAMTVYVGKGAPGVMLYNFIFLGVMTAIYIAGLAGGMFRMNNIARAFEDASVEIQNLMQKPGKIPADKIQILNGIFHHKYLDRTMDSFTDCIIQSEEGIGDVEDYFNEEELDNHIHKRLLEMVPDIFTSLGILGTFVGLVWGLKNFEPTNYEVMTTSVSALVDGIKVAFLTSIYGIALSIVYTYGMKSEYSSMAEALQAFLARFHSHVMPSAENESRNLLLSSQKIQTAAMNQMAEQFSVQMADSFEKVITPTFKKMNDSLDTLVSSVTRCQEDAVREILNVFLKEMNDSFGVQFSEFGNTLAQLKEAQTDNVNYTTNLYQAMSRQLSDSYTQHEQAMKKIMEEAGSSQKEYMDITRKIVRDNQEDPEAAAGRLSSSCRLSERSRNFLCKILGSLQSDYAEVCRSCSAGHGQSIFCGQTQQRSACIQSACSRRVPDKNAGIYRISEKILSYHGTGTETSCRCFSCRK